MKISHAVEATLRNLGLEMHHVALDGMDEVQQLEVLYMLAQITNSNLQSQLFQKQLEQEKIREQNQNQLNANLPQ